MSEPWGQVTKCACGEPLTLLAGGPFVSYICRSCQQVVENHHAESVGASRDLPASWRRLLRDMFKGER